jgi:hypothetical protein
MLITRFRSVAISFLATLTLPLAASLGLQQGNTNSLGRTQTADGIDVNRIISEVTARETEARRAFETYGYRCDLIIQTVRNSTITGVFKRSTRTILNKKGVLETKTVSFDRNTITEISITPQDIEITSPKYQFALETANATKYKFTFVSRQTVDRIDSFIFKVEPKRLLFRELLFNGHIWVRASDSKIYRMIGEPVQEGNQKFSTVETQRALFEDQYFFPVQLSSDEDVKFRLGVSVHIKMDVRFSEYIKLK